MDKLNDKKELPIEHTLVIVKPDGVFRAMIGKLVTRFEEMGLKVVAMKMVQADRELVGKHYADDVNYLTVVGEKCLENYQKYGFDPVKELGTKDPLEIGRLVRKWNMDYLTLGPVVAFVLAGPHAVELVRKMTGHTFPQMAQPGTIRGDWSVDSTFLSNILKRSVKNLLHASGAVDEAKVEIPLWFEKNEIYGYKRVDEEVIWG